MNDEKRPFLTIADVFILLGLVLTATGLGLYDWRLAMVAVGLVLILAGALRLRGAKQ